MNYCEIIIGPPGSGKSTYIYEKSMQIKDRNPFLINLDPGNIRDELYDYNIETKVRDYQKENNEGPNGSTKSILQDFVNNINNFYYSHLEDTKYCIIDLPGQVEFFITGDSLQKMINFLTKKNFSLVVVNLVDLVFFHLSPISTYLFTYISINLLYVPFVCVISKCDKKESYDMAYSLEEIANLNVLENLEPRNKFEKGIIEFLRDNLQNSYEILDYSEKDSMANLQLLIDKCSGYLYEDKEGEELISIKDK